MSPIALHKEQAAIRRMVNWSCCTGYRVAKWVTTNLEGKVKRLNNYNSQMGTNISCHFKARERAKAFALPHSTPNIHISGRSNKTEWRKAFVMMTIILEMISSYYRSSWKRNAIPITGCIGLYVCEMLRIPNRLHKRLTDGSRVFSLTHRSRSIPQNRFYFSMVLTSVRDWVTPRVQCDRKD
jgi:hypothetical protein